MEGQETYRFATRTLATTALDGVEQAGLEPDDIDLFIPHQANVRIIEAVAKGLDLPMDRMFVNVDRYGNTSAASVPDRPGRGGRRGPGQGRRPDRPRRLRRRASPRGAVAIEWTADPARGAARRCGRAPRTSRPAAGRLGLGRPDPGRRSPSSWPAPGPVASSPLDDVVPGEPEPGASRRTTEVRAMIDLTGKARPRHRRLARHRAGDRRSASPARAPTSRSATAATRRPRPRRWPRSRRSAGGRSPSRATSRDPAAAEALVKAAPRGVRQGRHPRQQRRHHPRRPDHADEPRGLARGPRDEPLRRVLHDQGGHPADAQGPGAAGSSTSPASRARPARPGQANYSSAKAGLIGLTKATARELASRGITVNAVAPGFVLTELTQDLPEALKDQITAATPLGRFGTTEEIADAVAFLASDEAAFITGQVLAVDGGLVMM